MAQAGDRTWAVVVLAGCALLTLGFGDWISLDAGAGGGVPGRAVFALVLLVTAVVLAVGQVRARQTLGGLLVGLVLLLVVVRFFTGFRFVWASGDPFLFVFMVALAVLGMGLLAPAHLGSGASSSADLDVHAVVVTRRQPLSVWARTSLWLLTGVVCAVFGHNLAGWWGVGAAVVLVALLWVVVRGVRRRAGVSRARPTSP